MSKRTRTGLYRGSVACWIIWALLTAPYAPTSPFLEAPCPDAPACPLRRYGFSTPIARGWGPIRFVLQILKVLLILVILAWGVANVLSFRDILKGVPTTSPASWQPSPTPRTTPNFQHPFLKTIHHDPTVQRYRPFFQLVEALAPLPNPHKRGPKKAKNTDRVYLKAYLVKLNEPIRFFTQLRQFLVERPALVVFMGFVLKGYTPQYGFDPEQTVVSAHQFSQKLRTAKENQAKGLFNQTVHSLKELGVLTGDLSCDTAEIWAPIKENNPKQYVQDRWSKDRIPKAAPSARLGTKPTHEKDPNTGKRKVRYYWGWKSAILAEKNRRFGVEVCVAEDTKAANAADVTFALPLTKHYRQQTHLFIRRFIADAAFDAWYVYQDIYGDKDDPQHGQAYIPLNLRGHQPKPNQFGPHGGVIAPCGKEMKPESAWFDPAKAYHRPACAMHADRRRDQCPYTPTQRKNGTVSCPWHHPQFHSRKGCTKTINLDDPNQLRFALNRSSSHFKHIFKERTTSERLFAHADQAAFEHPNVREGHAVAQLNTLTYTLINLKAILRVQAA